MAKRQPKTPIGLEPEGYAAGAARKSRRHFGANPLAVRDGTFRKFIENLPVMFYAVESEPPHRPIYISPTIERFGYPLEEWLTDPDIWDRIIHEQDRERVLTGTRAAIAAGEAIDFEYRVVGPKGELFWVRDRSCFIRDEADQPLCWQGVILDITDRKLAVLETQKRERLYRTLARHIPNTAVLLFDRDLRFTLADGQQLRKHGFSQEMFEGKTLKEAFPPEIFEEYSGYYLRALAGETVVFETVNQDGCFEIHFVPVRDENGEIFAGMVMWQDITERRRLDDTLKESEARYRQLFENANDIIYLRDIENERVTINDAAALVLGLSKEEAPLMDLADFIAPEHRTLVRQQLAKKISGVAHQTVYEFDCIRKDGTRVTLEVNSSLIKRGDKAVAVQGIARDITERKRTEELIRKNEERYRELFENANDVIYTHDMEGNFTSLNRAGEAITGYSREEALKLNIATVVAPEHLDFARTMTARKTINEPPTTYELEIIAKDGSRVPLELSTRLIVHDGLPVGVQGIGRDISERKDAQKSLHNTISLFASTFESTADGIVVMDLDQKVVTRNKKFVEMWHIPTKLDDRQSGPDLVKHIIAQVRDPEKFLASLQHISADPLSAETEIIELMDGRIFEGYSQPQFMEGVPVGRVWCFRDITERNLAEEKFRHYALHDTLTNLPNRVEFMNRLREAVERADGNEYARFAVLFLDLDRFKVINDSLGHAIGDKLLIAIAERLKACVRPGDVVARLGGDEFTILLNRSGDTSEVARVAERLQTKISQPFKIDNYEVFTTASIGIIVSGNSKRLPEEFLRDADAAMYRAKELGKARYEIFDREMHVRNMNLLQVETDLRHAVERGEFEVLYQPIVELATGRVCEFEALIRWRHPKHGMVAPNEFVGVAEETGLIIPIGKWILEESCRQIAAWQKRFSRQLAVSVNLSAKQLMHPTLTKQVRDILAVTGIDPGQLKLEVTESTVMEHSEKSLGVLSELDALGVALSTDDFGTGYSSLSYLQRFPFDRLKIDRSFINIMDHDAKSGAIVKTILMLGENLELEVVAEGIETESQLEQLRALGCKTGQGYYFSRPVDVEAAELLLLNGPDMFGLADTPQFRSPGPVIEVSDVQ
jgi:diguanylate cyclase (GGDEF)-like protein/PAS domain S-box-containing protein